MTQETKIIGIVSIVTIVVIVIALLFINSTQTSSATVNEEQLISSDSHKIWNKNASVTIVEFADFQCPACAMAQPTLRQILKEYEGKVNLVFRHFPLMQHKNALLAAQTAEAAGEQGKFWEMYDLLYENQSEWDESTTPETIFSHYAKSLHLNSEKFSADLKSKKYLEKIRSDQAAGTRLGVNSTPTFFVNGEKVTGVLSLEQFRTIVENKL